MAQAPTGTLKKTPLHPRHRSLGARMVEFGGWDMPVEYSGIADEHMAVRTRAGLFDVSHMGEIEIAGKDALAAVQQITSNDASKLADSQAQYSALTTPEGTFVDDVLTYRLNGEHFMLVVNASNIIKDFNWISARVGEAGDAVAVNTSSRYALIALQGPVAREVLQTLTAVQLDRDQVLLVHDRRGRRVPGSRFRARATRARTGSRSSCRRRWPSASGTRSCERGSRRGSSRPGSARAIRCGSRRRCVSTATTWTRRRRCSRRIWAGLSAGRSRTSSARMCSAVRRQDGVSRKLVGFEVLDRAIARHGHDVFVDGQKAGVVTSGTQTPFLKKAIGMAYVPIDQRRERHRVRDRLSRPPPAGGRGADAVLQAGEVGSRRTEQL